MVEHLLAKERVESSNLFIRLNSIVGLQPSGLTLYHPAGHLAQPRNPFGKDIANAGLFRALARHGGYAQLAVLNQVGLSAEALSRELFAPAAAAPSLATAPLWDTTLPARTGLLLRGQPYLSELAWLRGQAGSQRAYSLVGLIHSIAPPVIREQIGAAALAPVHPWDALICTSPAVQRAMEQLFASMEAWLQEHLGARRLPRPQLPLLPLGVEVETIARQADSAADRQALRQRFGIAESDLLLLWVGRLSYFEKAFPQVMFQAAQQAAQASGQRLQLLLVGWFPNGEQDRRLYQQAAAALAPDVPVVWLDGNDPSNVAQAWAAADVFLSLVDNIQETFGLAPVEAMAAGLPVVASDWDGYRYTIRDGQEGFLVPTLASPASPLGDGLAHRHALGLETYQNYVGAAAQHTAVNVALAAQAIARLASSPELRRRLGEAGRRRARSSFAWPVVVQQYNALFADLQARRLAAAEPPVPPAVQPVRAEPFAAFHGFATAVLQPDLRLQLAAGLNPAQAPALLEQRLAVELNRLYPDLRGTPEEARALLAQLAQHQPDGLAVGDLLARHPQERHPVLRCTLVWLAKLGLIDWRAPKTSPPVPPSRSEPVRLG